MGVLWCICGAGRRVGKTTFAQGLCNCLPESVYAKHGWGRARADKAPNYFSTVADLRDFMGESLTQYRHVVVESNALALGREGDIITYLAGPEGQKNPRPDAAASSQCAHIRIVGQQPKHEWKEALSRIAAQASRTQWPTT